MLDCRPVSDEGGSLRSTSSAIRRRASAGWALQVSFVVDGPLLTQRTNTLLHIFDTQSTCAPATARDLVVTTISLRGSRKEPFHMAAEHTALSVTKPRKRRATAAGTDQQQQLMDAIRQQQVQMQQQHQAQQPQGAPPTATAGMEKQFQDPQLNMRGFDDIETLSGGEDQSSGKYGRGKSRWPCQSQ